MTKEEIFKILKALPKGAEVEAIWTQEVPHGSKGTKIASFKNKMEVQFGSKVHRLPYLSLTNDFIKVTDKIKGTPKWPIYDYSSATSSTYISGIDPLL